MKKIYAILVAALFSAGMFAADAPTPTDLANANYDVVNNVVLCIHFVDKAEVCNVIYFVGSFSGWAESFNGCPKFRALQGFDGWYAAQAEYTEGFAGKPIQAKKDGSFSWDYQNGGVSAWKHIAGLEANITQSGINAKESDITYPSAGAYIYELSAWKNDNTPCVVAVEHDYTIYLYAPECEEAEQEYIPAIIGDFNGWAEGVTMNADIDGDGEVVYVATIHDEEKHEFKFRQAGISDWSNQIQIYVAEDDAYKENPNITLGAETTITLDYRTGKWSACGEAPVDSTVYYTIVRVNVPAGAPAAGVEIIGTFDKWSGSSMELLDNGWYFVKLDVIASDEFKFRETGSWENEIIVVATGEGLPNMKFEDYWVDSSYKGVDCKEIELDLSGEEYVWKANAQGIENVVLTEKAQKVVVDGAIYIIRDNKMFNIHGAQVR